MATLKLISLECIETEDLSGADEPYLLIKGTEVWRSRGGMNNKSSVDLSGEKYIAFTDKAKITLMEGDTGWNDDNDDLGTTYARVSMIGKGEQEPAFTGDGAHYILTYEVTE